MDAVGAFESMRDKDVTKAGTARIRLLPIISAGLLLLSLPHISPPLPQPRCTIDRPNVSLTLLTTLILPPRGIIKDMEDTLARLHIKDTLDMLRRLLSRGVHRLAQTRSFGIGSRR